MTALGAKLPRGSEIYRSDGRVKFEVNGSRTNLGGTIVTPQYPQRAYASKAYLSIFLSLGETIRAPTTPQWPTWGAVLYLIPVRTALNRWVMPRLAGLD
jgi:hypothetical protein